METLKQQAHMFAIFAKTVVVVHLHGLFGAARFPLFCFVNK